MTKLKRGRKRRRSSHNRGGGVLVVGRGRDGQKLASSRQKSIRKLMIEKMVIKRKPVPYTGGVKKGIKSETQLEGKKGVRWGA